MPYDSNTAEQVPCPNFPSASASLSLLERLKRHDSQAWQKLVELYTPLIYGWCRHGGLQAADAADVAQEVFSTVARKLQEFYHDQAGDSFRAWLCVITRHKLSEHFRRIQGQPQAKGGTSAHQQLQELPASFEFESAVVAISEERFLAHRVLDMVRSEFEDRTWQAFWRVVVEQRLPVDVAADLSTTLHAVYKAKSRILARIRLELAGLK